MCGIAGFTTMGPLQTDPRATIERMTHALAHRGPDGHHLHIDDGIALGHRRLSIIDLEGGTQPMHSPDGRFHLVFNGEIYNYIELRKALRERGCVFRTQSDAEVLLWQLILDGREALPLLNGMFAFALWDARERRLLLARDRIGEKPLYYTELQGDLVFASELRALLAHDRIERMIDPVSAAKFLTYGWVPAPKSIYRNVLKLMPGHCAVFERGRLAVDTYWDIPLQDQPVRPFRADECTTRFRLLLQDSIRLRLRSDVPVGVLLSGGLDSSSVVALAAPQAAGPVSTFSLGFDEPSYDETHHARRVAALFGTNHNDVVMTAQDAVALLPRAIQSVGEPFADASLLPSLHLFGLAARHTKVVLGGDGGDELLAGYPAFLAHRIVNALSFLPGAWRDVLTRVARHVPASPSYASADFLLQQFLRGAGISAEVRFLIWLGCCGNDERTALLSQDARAALLQENIYDDVVHHVQRSGLTDSFQRISYLAFKMYLQDGVLTKVDRASMAHGLEVRAPFLDHRLVEFACGVSPDLKLRGRTTKYLLKRAMAGVLPHDLVHRRKAGFMMPVARWLQTDLRAILEDACSERRLSAEGFFDATTVRRLMDEHMRGERDHRKQLWAILCYQCWRRTT